MQEYSDALVSNNKERLAEIDKKWLEQALEYEPEGKICFFCNKENDFADDCGFFYVTPDGPDAPSANKPCCKACWDGDPGNKHVARYGLGSR